MYEIRLNIIHIGNKPTNIEPIAVAMKAIGFDHHLTVVDDVLDALELIRHRFGNSDLFAPDLVLLDLRVANVDGFRVLTELRSGDESRQLPVFVLCDSDDERHREMTPRSGVEVIMTQPDQPGDELMTAYSLRDAAEPIARAKLAMRNNRPAVSRH